MKSKYFLTLVLTFLFSGLLIAGGCRTKPSTSPEGGSQEAPTSTAIVQPTHTAVPVVPTATATPSSVVIQTITSSQFTSVVLNSHIPVMVYCTASWCSVCVWMDPYVQQFANDHVGTCLVVKVDCTNGTPAFVNTYGVPGYPTSLFFSRGVYVTSIVGGVDENALDQTLATL